MPPPENATHHDWVERVVALTARLGFNPVRTRWKLLAFQRRVTESCSSVTRKWQQVRYSHQLCSSCNAVQDRNDRVCSQCGRKLDPRWLQVMNRINVKLGARYSSSFLLGVLILVGFWRSCIGPDGFDFSRTTNGIALYESGGSVALEWLDGEWWRLATCIFLHAGLMHLLFNLVALKQIGPEVESIFGRGRMLFFFMVTGIVASIGSALTGTPGVRIGASGAIMGLIGIAAGWGHRLGTNHGQRVRNDMLRWAMYTIVYGYVLSADNMAHAVGFIAGGLIGLVAREQNPRARGKLGDWALTLCGLLLTTTALGLILLGQGKQQEFTSGGESGNQEESTE